MRVAIAIFSVPLIFFTLYLALRAYGAMQHGYTWQEMDWDGDGTTTIIEFFGASDVGKRPLIDNPKCVEYFAYKDGYPVRIVCP